MLFGKKIPWQQIQNLLKAQCQRPIWHQRHKAHQNHNHKAHLRYPLVLCIPFFPRPTKESSLIPHSLTPTPPTSKSALLLNNFAPISSSYITLHVKNIFFINICMHVFLFSWTMWVLFLVGLCCFFVGLKSSVQEKTCLFSENKPNSSFNFKFANFKSMNKFVNIGFDLTIYNII